MEVLARASQAVSIVDERKDSAGITSDNYQILPSSNQTIYTHPDDLLAAIACVELCREIGNSAALRPFAKREVMPGNLKGAALERFIRDGAMTYWHETCTAKMGRDPLSVVDDHLSVYGVTHLRVADGSIMPRVTTGNTQAPCVIIGERAAEILRAQHRL